MVKILRRYADAGILNRYLNATLFLRLDNKHKSALFGIFYCVVDYVDKDLLKPVGVAQNYRLSRRRGVRKLYSLLFGKLGIHINRRSEQPRNIYRSGNNGKPARLHT